MHFLRGKRRRRLFEPSDALGGEPFKHRLVENGRRIGALRFSIGIVGVGGEAERESGGVALAPASVELHQPGGAPKQQYENSGGQRVERSQVADLPESREMAHRIDDVVGSLALGLVDHKGAVKGRWLRLAWHSVLEPSDQKTKMPALGPPPRS